MSTFDVHYLEREIRDALRCVDPHSCEEPPADLELFLGDDPTFDNPDSGDLLLSSGSYVDQIERGCCNRVALGLLDD